MLNAVVGWPLNSALDPLGSNHIMNDNMYESPKSDVSTGRQTTLSIKRRLLWTVAILFTAILYRGINKIAPQFAETFTSFGAQLPLITRLFVKAYPVFYWFGIISLLPMIFWLVSLFGDKCALKVIKIAKYNLCLAVLCFVLFMVAIYYPIFTMGKVN